MLQPFPIERFRGLDLRSDPQEVGAEGALDILNVRPPRDGRIVTRDGYSSVYAGPAACTNMYPLGSEQVVAGFNANSVKAVDLTTGTAIASTAVSSAVAPIVSAGPSGSIYFGDGSFAQIKKYSGGAFSSPASLATMKAYFLAVQPLEDRLVVADAATKLNRLIFSDPGAPETFTYNPAPTPATGNYVDLEPGDGEVITGMGVFETSLFVFKQSKFFVFYGNSTGATGTTTFNYRMIDTGVGIPQASGDKFVLTATHPSGLYFVGADGVYRTTGAEPVCVSEAIAPAFKGANLATPSTFGAATSSLRVWGMLGIAADRLYLSGVFGGECTYVMDLDTGEWSVSDLLATSVLEGSTIASGTDSSGYMGGAVFGGGTWIALSNRAKTTDDGVAIAWRYSSGLYQIADPGRAAITRESRVWGTGTVTLQVANDHGAFDAGSALTLGASPATADAWQQTDREGTWWQHKLSGSGAATVNRLMHYKSFEKPAGVE